MRQREIEAAAIKAKKDARAKRRLLVLFIEKSHFGLERLGTKFDIREDDTDEASVPVGNADFKYLGAVPTTSPGGPEVIVACYDVLKV